MFVLVSVGLGMVQAPSRRAVQPIQCLRLAVENVSHSVGVSLLIEIHLVRLLVVVLLLHLEVELALLALFK